MKEIVDYIRRNEKQFIEDLDKCLRIPSISVSRDHKKDVKRCAEFLKNKLGEIGFKNCKIFKTPLHPIVYAEWMQAPGKPTLLIYGHYDVQPVDPLNEWLNPPFEPQIRGGDLYARGSVDDKGQVYIHLSALKAFYKVHRKFPLNVKVFLEGEEEIGSPSLEDFMKKYKNLLKADYVIISDTPMLDKGVPSICYGLRGLCYMELEVTGPSQDLHSGILGGIVANPAHALVRILEQLKDLDGKVKVPGFYQDVRSLSKKERKMLSQLPNTEKKILKMTGSPALHGEKGFTTFERMWARPTLDINGVFGGFSGQGSKTIIPAKAGAKVSMRLVPDQDPDKIAIQFKKYIEKIAPKNVRVRVVKHHGSRAFLENFNQPVFDCIQKSLTKAFGKKAYFMREGGTIPFVKSISEILKIPCLLLGFGLPDENAHAPNERLHLENYQKGILSMAYFYDDLSRID